MDILNNIGISYKGDYILQGSQIDKYKKSSDLDIKNTEFTIRNDGKDIDFENITSVYSGNLIFHLPTINVNQSNLKIIKNILNILMKNDIKFITIDASTLLYETFDWSTTEEQQNYLKNMAKGLSSLISSGVKLAIENPNTDNDNSLFGKSISNLSDLLVYTRNALVEQYNYTREKANEMVGISLNIHNLEKNGDISDLDNWFKVFYNDIKCVKVRNVESNILLFSQILDNVINNPSITLILESEDEIENIANVYKKFEFLVKNKIEGKPLNFDHYQNIVKTKDTEYDYNFKSPQGGYTTIVIIGIIIMTIIIASLMIIIQTRR